jgi:RNase adapter protein RapZ
MGRVVLVTGMAGAGRTTALKALEDIGFEAVDNLPATLLRGLLRSGDRIERDLAIGIDCRARAFDPVDLRRQLEQRSPGQPSDLRLLFLDCEDQILRPRLTETRRRHPLALDRPVTDGIVRERHLMAPLRERADLVIDTSQLTPGDLRRLVVGHFAAAGEEHLTLSVISFAYRNGLPREADLVFDVRFLANPHYVDELRPLTGQDQAVQTFIEADPAYDALMDRLGALLLPLLPSYRREGKSYLTIAFGCTGGRHRSVLVAERFAEQLRAAGWPVRLHHRDAPVADHDRAAPSRPSSEGGEA